MKPFFLLLATILISFVAPSSADSRDWHVHHEIGSDDNDGSLSAPFATAQAAVDRAQTGDRVLLLPEGALYRQSILLNRGQSGIVIEGNGVTLSGADPLDPDAWESLGEDLYRMRLPRTAWNRHLLIVNGKAQRMGRLTNRQREFPPTEDLKPGEFRWDEIDDEEGWLSYRGETENLEWSTRRSGFATTGDLRNIKVYNLQAKHFLNDGFNIHGNARGMQFFHIAGIENFDEGFSAHDTATCWIQHGIFRGNENAIADVNEADSYYLDCEFTGSESVEVLFQGGRHSLTRCRIIPGPDAIPLTIRAGNSADTPPESQSATLTLREVSVEAEATSRPMWNVGPGSLVLLDPFTTESFAALEKSLHPTSRVSSEPYWSSVIGRDGQGEPLTTWSVGGVRPPTQSNYRIIHFDKHNPQEIAAGISPENDWFGLSTPLPTGSFPPQGDAFAPDNEAAHAIWRWIGLTAPDAVFVPDTPEGLALGTALQSHPPAGVGMVDVFLAEKTPTEKTITSVLPKPENGERSAKMEMMDRMRRSPQDILSALSEHYGNQFDGGYLDGVALIAKMRGGIAHEAPALARAGIDAPLPTSSGTLSGTLLFAEIAEPWAIERVLRVADLAFDTEGKPLEAMPTHNEMSDAVFMAGPLLVRAGEFTGEARYYDQAVQQVRYIQSLCLRRDGLYRHSPLNEAAWGRGNGFPALGITLMLDHFPGEHPGRAFLEESLLAHLEALAAYQDQGGMWHQVIDHEDSYAEFTATCMIAYSILRGIREGRLDHDLWTPRVWDAWDAIRARIGTDGKTLLNVCTGTGKQKTLEDYYQRKAILGPDARGGALAMLLAAEVKQWDQLELR